MYVHGFWEPELGLVVTHNPGIWTFWTPAVTLAGVSKGWTPTTDNPHCRFCIWLGLGGMDLVWSWPKSGKARFGHS